jgi:hypothetical protein
VYVLHAGISDGGIDADLARIWLATVHLVCREIGARVEGALAPPDPGRNYYRVPMTLAGGVGVRMLLHAGERLVACVDGPDDSVLVAPFREVPRPDLFELAGFSVAEPEQMERPLTDADVAGLTGHERRDIDYHRPPRIGDVVFNWFD